MKIFITGASGFVGGAAARRFAADGHEVVAMSRSEASDARIRDCGARPVRCDLESVTAAHLDGAEVVIHAAAFVEAWGPPDAWSRINVAGTKRMLAAASSAGVRRFIHIGTEAAIVFGQDVHNADETVPLAPSSPYPYCSSKAQAEMAVVAANGFPPGFETIVLRPRFIWGPGDETLLPQIRRAAESGAWIWVDHGRALTSTVHIDNLVDAIGLAFSAGRAGQAYYILDEGTRSMREIIEGMAAAHGLVLPARSIPRWLADWLGGAMEAIWRQLGLRGTPPLTRHVAMVLSRDCTLNGAKAAAELGYRPRVSVADGLAQVAAARQ